MLTTYGFCCTYYITNREQIKYLILTDLDAFSFAPLASGCLRLCALLFLRTSSSYALLPTTLLLSYQPLCTPRPPTTRPHTTTACTSSQQRAARQRTPRRPSSHDQPARTHHARTTVCSCSTSTTSTTAVLLVLRTTSSTSGT